MRWKPGRNSSGPCWSGGKQKSERLGALKKELNHLVIHGTFNTTEQMETNEEEDRVAHSNKFEVDTDG
jgi:hypothetical protein